MSKVTKEILIVESEAVSLCTVQAPRRRTNGNV